MIKHSYALNLSSYDRNQVRDAWAQIMIMIIHLFLQEKMNCGKKFLLRKLMAFCHSNKNIIHEGKFVQSIGEALRELLSVFRVYNSISVVYHIKNLFKLHKVCKFFVILWHSFVNLSHKAVKLGLTHACLADKFRYFVDYSRCPFGTRTSITREYLTQAA